MSIVPIVYGANNDRCNSFDCDLTDDEMLADTIIDLKPAHKLGCKVMRSQIILSPAAFERLAPYAEMFDVKVGIEIHILKDSDFNGYVISEYEDEIGCGGKEFTRRHLEIEKRF